MKDIKYYIELLNWHHTWIALNNHVRPKHNNDEANSDGEEEFYFIEVEASEDVPTQQSSEELSHVTRITSRRCRSYSDPSVPTEPPVSSTSHRHLDDNFIWPLRHSEGRRGKLRRHYNLKKSRGDGKKCRKVFGMENKHLWCTQCRWKKACVKFVDWGHMKKNLIPILIIGYDVISYGVCPIKTSNHIIVISLPREA